jgi:hypothetical protein
LPTSTFAPLSSRVGPDAIAAFRSLSSAGSVEDWDARSVVEKIAATDERLGDWRAWMLARYFT